MSGRVLFILRRLVPATILLTAAVMSHGQRFNVREDFVASTSQEGPWFYGHRNTVGGSYANLENLEIIDSVPTLTTLLGQQVWKNNTGDNRRGIPNGSMSLAPGLLGEPAVIRFIVPKTGTINLSGKFGIGESGLPRTRTILLNGKEIFRDEGNGEKFFFFPLRVSQGDVIDQQVEDRPAQGQNTPVECEVAYVSPQGIGFGSNAITGGRSTVGSVFLDGVAPEGGVRVNLYVGKPDVLHVPGFVLVPEGESSANFNITSSATETDQQVQVTAKANGNHIKSYLKVLAPRLDTFAVGRKLLRGTGSTTATVTLTGPAKSDIAVNIGVDDPTVLSVPSSVVIPAGQSSATFTLSGLAPATEKQAKVTIGYLARTRWVVITVRPN
jgi:hypothetical protein